MTDSAAFFETTRARFDLPEGLVYLDGNSLGPLPRHVPARVERALREEWGARLIRGWNDCGWMGLPEQVGDRIAPMIGAAPGSVRAADSTSANLFKCLSATLALRPGRKVILSDTGNFPTDLYVAQRLIAGLGQGHELRLVAPEAVEQEIARAGDALAVLMLTQVDYRTGRRHELARLTEAAHAVGALTLWDLAHSAGAFAVDLSGAGADFAIGCGYKYLNGGPGAPAFLHVSPALQDQAAPILAGWMGHAAPFDFVPDYVPATGMDRMLVGTPPILGMTALDAALDVWEGVDLTALRARSVALCERLIAGVEAAAPDLVLASPRAAEQRGSQVSFRHEQGYAVMQALIARGVVGDFRAPDMIRFGLAPLYNTEADVDACVAALAEILETRAWDRPEFLARARVT